MADYCTANDVKVLLGFRQDFSATTRPTLAEVEEIIDEVTNEIDFTLASVGITTQPTDTRLLGRLKKACKYGSACQTGMSAFGNNTNVDDTQPGYYCEIYQSILDDIRANPGNYGLVTDDSSVYMSSNVTDGTNSESDFNYHELDYEV